jgi:hypothetical protein
MMAILVILIAKISSPAPATMDIPEPTGFEWYMAALVNGIIDVVSDLANGEYGVVPQVIAHAIPLMFLTGGFRILI